MFVNVHMCCPLLPDSLHQESVSLYACERERKREREREREREGDREIER